MLTLVTAKAHLKLDPTEGPEDELLAVYVAGVNGAFATESKRRWPVEGEPTVDLVVTDTSTEPPTVTRTPLRYADSAVLNANEQATARMWLLLVLGHWYENRGAVAVGLNVTEVPLTAKMLMNLLREPTL